MNEEMREWLNRACAQQLKHPPLCEHCDDPSYCMARPADDRWCKDGCAGEMLCSDAYRALRIAVWVVAVLAGVAAGWMIFG